MCVCVLDVITASEECDYYSQRNCKSGIGQCHGTQVCPTVEPGKRSHCYVFWNVTSGVAEVILKGCWLDTPECYDQLMCVATEEQTPSTFFCCCERRLCNVNFSVSPDVVMLAEKTTHIPRGNYKELLTSSHSAISKTLDSYRHHLKTYYFQSAHPVPYRPSQIHPDSLLRLWRYINILIFIMGGQFIEPLGSSGSLPLLLLFV